MLPLDSDERSLTLAQAIAVYLGVMAVLFAAAFLLHAAFRLDIRPAAALSLGIVYLVTASRRPWWLFYVMRNIRAFGWMDEDSVQTVCLVIGCALVALGLLWHPHGP